MSKQSNKPLYRVSFCPIHGQHADGGDIMGRSVEIGAVWTRKDPTKGAMLKLNIVPQNLTDGVIFLNPVEDKDRGFA
ncbi:MAG: hypothetical protein AAFV45_15015 [Pseudomonadota bacterium]